MRNDTNKQGIDVNCEIWRFQEAKAKLSEVLNRVEEYGSQMIVRNKKNYFVILTEEKYRSSCLSNDSIMDIFQRYPFPEVELSIERSKETLRDLDL